MTEICRAARFQRDAAKFLRMRAQKIGNDEEQTEGYASLVNEARGKVQSIFGYLREGKRTTALCPKQSTTRIRT